MSLQLRVVDAGQFQVGSIQVVVGQLFPRIMVKHEQAVLFALVGYIVVAGARTKGQFVAFVKGRGSLDGGARRGAGSTRRGCAGFCVGNALLRARRLRLV